jgi:hypothetical protein
MNTSYDLRSINFGFARAETERTEAPSLLREGYFDEQGLTKSALEGPTFLYLGNKGAGKSALVNHLDLELQNRYNSFSTIYQLEDFSFQNFSKIIRGDQEPEAKFPDAWAWLLLIIALESLSRDEGVWHPDAVSYNETVNSLKQMGFMPNSSLRHIANITSRKTFKLTIPYVFESSEDFASIDKVNDIPMFVHNMKRIICSCRTESNHIIMLGSKPIDHVDLLRQIRFKIPNQWIGGFNGSLVLAVGRAMGGH